MGSVGCTIGELGIAYNADSFSYTNGAGDSGAWTSPSPGDHGGLVLKARNPGVGYTPYSAYATYTVREDSDNLYLGYEAHAFLSGVLRVKVNGQISTTGEDLDANGDFVYSLYGSFDLRYSHIARHVSAGDVITIEVKDSSPSGKDRALIHSMVESTGTTNPGDTGWVWVGHPMQSVTSADTFAAEISGTRFFGGPAHPGHEYSPTLALTLDGVGLTLGDTIQKGQVLSGASLTARATVTAFTTARGVDDFATYTRDFVWSDNQFTTWRLNFIDTVTFSRVYQSMHSLIGTRWGAFTNPVFRYISSGSSNIYLPIDNSNLNGDTGPRGVPGTSFVFFGGDYGLKMTQTNSSAATDFFVGGGTQKAYQAQPRF